jgi:type VI secretion system (T6SS) tail sheath-like EvpB family protein
MNGEGGSAGRDARRRTRPGAELDSFLAEASFSRSLLLWFGTAGPFGGAWNRAAILLALDAAVAEVDLLISEQVAAILRHPDFQALEAGWRSLANLVSVADNAEQMRICVLHLT